jgi:hypothetical protein
MNAKTANWIAYVNHKSKKPFVREIYCRKCDSMTQNEIAFQRHYYESTSELKVVYTQRCSCCKKKTLEVINGNNWSALFNHNFFD